MKIEDYVVSTVDVAEIMDFTDYMIYLVNNAPKEITEALQPGELFRRLIEWFDKDESLFPYNDLDFDRIMQTQIAQSSPIVDLDTPFRCHKEEIINESTIIPIKFTSALVAFGNRLSSLKLPNAVSIAEGFLDDTETKTNIKEIYMPAYNMTDARDVVRLFGRLDLKDDLCYLKTFVTHDSHKSAALIESTKSAFKNLPPSYLATPAIENLKNSLVKGSLLQQQCADGAFVLHENYKTGLTEHLESKYITNRDCSTKYVAGDPVSFSGTTIRHITVSTTHGKVIM